MDALKKDKIKLKGRYKVAELEIDWMSVTTVTERPGDGIDTLPDVLTKIGIPWRFFGSGADKMDRVEQTTELKLPNVLPTRGETTSGDLLLRLIDA